jgi:hypothetical protein
MKFRGLDAGKAPTSEHMRSKEVENPQLLILLHVDNGFIRCSASLPAVVSTSAAQMIYPVMRFLTSSHACCEQRRHLGIKCRVYFIDICRCPRLSLESLWCICAVQQHFFSVNEEYAWDPCLYLLHYETSLLWYVTQGCHEKVNLLIDLSRMKVDASSSVCLWISFWQMKATNLVVA